MGGETVSMDGELLQEMLEAYIEEVCAGLQQSGQSEVYEKFETEAEEVQARLRKEKYKWVPFVNPLSHKRLKWDMCILTCLLYTAFSVPYRMAFDTSSILFFAMDVITSWGYFMDVGWNLITGYFESNGTLQNDPLKVAEHYLRTWFLIDLLSAVPLQDLTYLVDTGDPRSDLNAFLRGYPIFNCLRLPRLTRVFESKEIAIYVGPSQVRLIVSLILCAWLFHAVTCLYWYIASRESFVTSWAPDPAVASDPNSQNYLITTVWTISTTFGYQPPTFPVTAREAIFTVMATLLGICLSSYIISIITSALTPNEDDEDEIAQRKTEALIFFMRRRDVPLFFQRIIVDYYEAKGFQDQRNSPLEDVPPIIGVRLSLLLNRHLITTIPMLQSLDLNTILLLMQNLREESLMPGDWVYEKDDPPEHLYFIKKGAVEILLDGNAENVCSTLTKGMMFGQVAIFTDELQECSARALMYSEILYLDKDVYDDPQALSYRFKDLVSTETKREQHRIKTFRSNMKNAKLNKERENKLRGFDNQPRGGRRRGGGDSVFSRVAESLSSVTEGLRGMFQR